MKKSIIYLLFFFAVCAFTPNIVFAQADEAHKIVMRTFLSSLDFGNVFVGRTKSLTITIENEFSALNNPLICSWGSINPPFSISPVGIFRLYSLPPRNLQIFTITFTPTAFISYNQTITLFNNATILGLNCPGVLSVIGYNNSQYIFHIIGTGVKETIIQPKTPGPAKMMQYGTGKY